MRADSFYDLKRKGKKLHFALFVALLWRNATLPATFLPLFTGLPFKHFFPKPQIVFCFIQVFRGYGFAQKLSTGGGWGVMLFEIRSGLYGLLFTLLLIAILGGELIQAHTWLQLDLIHLHGVLQ